VSSDAAAIPEPRGAIVIAWEEARLKAIMPRVVSRAMSYSAMACFDEALIASVQRFYGLDVDVATAETEVLEDDIERVRFFPWFLWDFTFEGAGAAGVTVGRRFLAEGDLTPVERRVLVALCDTVVDFWEVTAIVGGGLVVRSLALGERARIDDEVLARELVPGQVLQGRLVVIPPEAEDEAAQASLPVALIDAIYAVLPAATRAQVEAELLSVAGALEEFGSERMRERLKQHAPELIDFAEYLLESAGEAAVVANADGETMVLCSTIVPLGHALALEAALVSGELDFRATSGDTWVYEDDGKPIGFVTHDAIRGRWIVGAPSRERLARMCGRLRDAGLATAGLHAEETLERAATSWIETGVAGPHLNADPEVRRAFEGWVGGRWIDTPNAWLGDASPRVAARDEALRPALAGLVARLEAILGRPVGRDLGL